MLQNISLYFQWLSSTPGNSMQHERDMDGINFPLTDAYSAPVLMALISID